MRKAPAALLAALILTGCAPKIIQNVPTAADNTVYTRDSAGIRAEDDFYGCTNFDFLYTNNIPAGMNEYSGLRLLGRQIEDALSEDITRIAESGEQYPAGSDEQRIKDLYAMYLDTEARERTGLAPLEKGFTAIRSARTAEDFARACGRLVTDYDVSVLPGIYVMQDEYDSSRYSVYLWQMGLLYSAEELLCGKDTAETLQKQAAQMLDLLGHEDADSLAYDIVTMLLSIAENTADAGTMSVEERYNLRSFDELDPRIAAYLGAAGFGGQDIVVCDTAQLDKVCGLLTNDNLELWQGYAECVLLYGYMDSIPESVSERLGGKGRDTAEKKAVTVVKKLLPAEVENVCVRKYRDDRTAAAAKQLTEDILVAYEKCIESSAQLTENDRAECLAKIRSMTVNIGCPTEESHSGAAPAGSLLESAVSIRSVAQKERFARLGGSPSPTEWDMPPQAVNAVYDPQSNSITVPMALFSPPVFDAEGDYWANLGGLGSIIAHETGHAFDAEGILYDEQGHYRPGRISTARTDLLNENVARYFGGRQIMGTYFVDGELTKQENAADLSGMQVICSMTSDRGKLRTIFESYARLWATLAFDTDAAAQLTDDVHSPPEIRVNAVLSSTDRFYEAYDIKETDGMYLPPDERVRVW